MPDHINQVKELFSQALSAVNSSSWDEAEDCCRKILDLLPGQSDATYMLGHIYQATGRNKLAISRYEKVIPASNYRADALNNIGTIQETSGDKSAAVRNYSKAIEHNPSHFLANYNLGRISRLAGDLSTAEKALETALTIDSNSVPTLLELGLVLKNRGETSAALIHLLKARDLSPEDPAIHNLLGNTYQLAGKLSSALPCYLEAIKYKPDFAEAYNNLGSTYIAMGNVASGLHYYEKAVELLPHWIGAASNRLLAENYISFNQEDLFISHLQWADSLNQEISRPFTKRITGKIRLGYISPDFRAHSVAWFLMAIFRNYDRSSFEVSCFSDTNMPDSVTREIRSLVDNWHHIHGLSDNEACNLIRRKNIDILIDLAGHTANNRLGIFAMQAAPVQATYLGYPNTTGLKTISYRITDNVADPPGHADRMHTEELVRLPNVFLCYTPSEQTPECSSSPFDRNNYITFGSFNVLAKISEACIETWSAILLQHGNSKLILKSAGLEDEETRNFMMQKFRQNNVRPEQIEMIPRTTDIRSHLELYSQIDITLDTFPYNGTTTTCESLWMGVPVITLSGSRHAGRVGCSLLTQVGLESLIADDQDEYIFIASKLALNPEKTKAYRRTLRKTMIKSPLCDGPGFVRSLEKAFMKML